MLLNPHRFGVAGPVPVADITWVAASKGSSVVLSESDRRMQTNSSMGARGSSTKIAGKSYLEVLIPATVSPQNIFCGFGKDTFNGAAFNHASNKLWLFYANSTDSIASYGGTSSTGVITGAPNIEATVGGILQFALDHDTGALLVGYNNTWKASSVTLNGLVGNAVFPAAFAPSTSTTNSIHYTLRGKSTNQSYTPPSGFTPWDELA